MENLSKDNQYHLLRNLVSSLQNFDKFNVILNIAAYSSIMGGVSEKTVVSLISYADLSIDDPLLRKVFRFYRGTGIIKIYDEGLGFCRSTMVTKLDPDIDQEQIDIAMKAIEKVRRSLINE